MTRRFAAGTGLLVVLTLVALTATGPAAGSLAPRVVFVACALAASAWLWVLARRAPAGLSARWVFGVAVGLRLAALPLSPTLSDDGYRYVWDGRQTVEAGRSPYGERPSDRAEFDPVLFGRLNSPDYYSVYPPASQAVFAVGAWVGRGDVRVSWLVIKVLTVLAELVGIAALLGVASPAAVILYAWHPLAVVEIAGQGHTEGLLVGALGLVAWSLGRRPTVASLAVVLATAVKLWPVALALPVVRRGGRRGQAMIVAGLGVVALPLVGPLAAPGAWGHVAESLALYAGHFDWYAPLYLGLKAALWPLGTDEAGRWTAVMLSALWLAGVGALALADDGSRAKGAQMLVGVVASYVVLSPVLHPWHLLPLLCCMPLLQLSHFYWLVTMSMGTYLAASSSSVAYPTILVMGWGGALIVWLTVHRGNVLARVLRRRALGKWRRMAPFVTPLPLGVRLLDLGCGEGFVGQIGAEMTGVAVTLADVSPLNRTPRPLICLQTDQLPFHEGAFHATVLSYVLHHAARPERLLTEAVRVSRSPVVCLESVVRWSWTRPLLQITDQTINRIRNKSPESSGPPAWRSIPEWREGCEKVGLAVSVHDERGWLHPTAVLVVSASPATVATRASSQTASARRRSHVH